MGMGGSDTLVGMGGNDILIGGAGRDTLIGINATVRHPGRREIDRFIGGSGRDLMVLGDADDVFYSDGRANSRGLQDYALVQQFNRRQDRIQLHGDRTDYVLGNVPNQTGTGIFLNTERAPELIAVVQGNGALNLNSNSFQFVG
jgi:Ca2+-binding RTX toxin-like protein